MKKKRGHIGFGGGLGVYEVECENIRENPKIEICNYDILMILQNHNNFSVPI